jgi:hypothetical protein
MSTKPSPFTTLTCRPTLVYLVLTLVTLAATLACGGGVSHSEITTGGGGGGGGTSGAACATAVTASVAPSISTSPTVANGVGSVTPSTFMDLHVGSSNLISGVTIPFGSLRLWDTSTGWAQINTGAPTSGNPLGVFDFSNLDGFVSATPSGADLLYNLGRTPTWASSNPNDSSCSYDSSTQGGAGQCDPPADLNSDGSGTDQDWINWVTAVAQRNAGQYGDKIKYFEIWNEWNISLFWTGSAAQLVRMEQDASCVIEGTKHGSCSANGSVFPSGIALDTLAQVVSPSPVGAATDLNQVSKDLTTYFGTTVGGIAGGTFADAIGFHGYVSTPSSSDPCPVAEDVNTVVGDLNGVVAGSSEGGKPWFDTEDSWGKAPDEGFEDADRQAAFLARDFLLQRSMGVARVYWYRWDATQTYGGALWTSSSGITEAGSADGEVNAWIDGATLNSACTVNGTVWQCGFTRSGGYQALAVWDASQDCFNGTCGTTNFTVPGSYTKYLDLAGNETSAASGSTIQIGAKPILLENQTLP